MNRSKIKIKIIFLLRKNIQSLWLISLTLDVAKKLSEIENFAIIELIDGSEKVTLYIHLLELIKN
jgi:hypothetical protein